MFHSLYDEFVFLLLKRYSKYLSRQTHIFCDVLFLFVHLLYFYLYIIIFLLNNCINADGFSVNYDLECLLNDLDD